MDFLRNWTDVGQLTGVFASLFDLDGNGTITVREFEQLMPCIRVLEPRVHAVSFADFKKHADTIAVDGVVSIEECANWMKETLTHALA